MLESMLFAIGSWFSILLLIIVYAIKVKEAGIKNYLYNISIILLFFMATLQLISVFTVANYESFYIINEIICRIVYSFTIIWLMVVSIYIISKYKNLDMSNLTKMILNVKTNKTLKNIFIIYSIFFIIFFFLPFKYIITDSTGYVWGLALYFVYFISIISGMILTLMIFKLMKNETFIKKIPIYFSILETIIIVPLQLFYPEILIVSSGLVFKSYLIYFLFENTDLYIIKELKKSKENLDKSSNTKSEFLFNMSHEIRTPMNAIVGFSENILNEKKIDKESIKKDVKNIQLAGENLLEIINNILDISKIETDEKIIENKEYDINSIVSELRSIIESKIDKSKLTFITNVDSNIGVLKGNKIKLFQILLNLLNNSIKFTKKGKIELKITQTKKDKIALLHIEIIDTGYGIKEEDYNKLFQKSSKVEGITKNEIDRIRLGLTITKRNVELLNGKIWFESTYKKGTTVYIELEQKTANDDDNLNTNLIENIQEHLDCSQYKILIVDDNLLNLKVAEKLLQPYKFNITKISNPKECINNIKLGNEYDMIFLDHMMPDINGIEVLHIFKKLEGYKIPPVVALTANATTGMRDMYINEGFDEYLCKPIDTKELNRIIIKYFSK